ncbi:MAG: N-formyl-4-amino-5-aminomethyl-2-methylpyrimidine deformylase [Paracidovorax wautersii]|uniref:Probable succinyl-diaminopimelate desuccinylase n=1 Tax=Paracidovorax wautersii TaxID=1177982 RepID=A0A7V8FMS1_9BURK|nr:MAG: N-formyl-4-amino-5-aminomethyl-2-methylpyrimidine deformylase [Paracidovorax wautersii]
MPSLTSPDTASIQAAVARQEPYLVETLSRLVAAASPSGAEQPAVAVMEAALAELGLASERIVLDSHLLANDPLFSCPCDPDGGRYNLLARHVPAGDPGPGEWARSVLFNGHLDVVPTGPDDLWTRPPYEPWVADGWLHGRGAGDMKGGLVCALAALRTLHDLGLEPAGIVGFNAVLDEENTGNGTLATLHALRHALGKARLTDFDAVIIPEPFGETLMAAQVGVCWLFVTLTGRPAHVAYMGQGLNPIEAGIALVADLKLLETEWNAPENRHPAFEGVEHPINFNLGRIEGGEWSSSVPCTCTLGLRFGFFPGMPADEAIALISARIRAKVAQINADLTVEIVAKGHRSPGCVYDLDTPAMQLLAGAHEKINGQPPRRLACTATTDGRHFQLGTTLPVTNYGPLARHIHGIDEAVSIESMKRVTATMVQFIVDWCGVRPRA